MPLMILVLIFAVSLFTAATIAWDVRFKKIPNQLTIPMFFAGWVYQLVMSMLYGWHHLGSAALGFLLGFGILFVLWFVGGGGGGDVKLIGALSVWLGFQMTLYVLILSTLIVLVSTVGVVLWSLIVRGARSTKGQYLGTGKNQDASAPRSETASDKVNRRVMTFAGPVGIATWVVLFWFYPQLTTQLSADEARDASAAVTSEVSG